MFESGWQEPNEVELLPSSRVIPNRLSPEQSRGLDGYWQAREGSQKLNRQ
ncbi:MAG TPA: hypothetical protein VE868_00490 [Balneolaceae bacterium]|nr:hypothetical protein [Balneolaceae bacterium]